MSICVRCHKHEAEGTVCCEFCKTSMQNYKESSGWNGTRTEQYYEALDWVHKNVSSGRVNAEGRRRWEAAHSGKLWSELRATPDERNKFEITLTPEEEAVYAQIFPSETGVLPASDDTKKKLGLVLRDKKERAEAMDREPTHKEKFAMLVRQGLEDYVGVKFGTYHSIGNKIKRTGFEAAHLVSQKESERPHWWNEDGTPNWRIVAEFINSFESSYPFSADRDAAIKQRLRESGIGYNIEWDGVVTIDGQSIQIERLTGRKITA